MKRQRTIPQAAPQPGPVSSLYSETEALRRRLAEVEPELEFYRKKQAWLESALADQRHARQVLEASLSANYSNTVNLIRGIVQLVTPKGATVLVVSRGDQDLMNLEGRRAWHFPQDDEGRFAGYYPGDSAAAISHLRLLITKGAEFLVLPNTSFWWLEHYREWGEWLEEYHRAVWRDERCAVYKLSRQGVLPAKAAALPSDSLLRGNGKGGSGDSSAELSPRAVQKKASHKLPDIVCFPIINWGFRFQRPQQLMLQFARAGHRVFYLSHQFRSSGDTFELRVRADSLWEATLRGPRFHLHQGLLDEAHCEALAASLSALRREHALETAVAIVQSPFWWPLVKTVETSFTWPVVYDCMDRHAGFSTSNPLLVEQERQLFTGADLVVASSSALEAEARKHNQDVLLLHNACDYEHFANIAPKDPGPRPVIGYYGAISNWFDSDLVADLAERRPDWDFLLVGSTLSGDVSRLSRLANVTLTGEKPYSEIPGWLARFDVAILPFKRTPLTEAANPVKAYEILAGGKPLVSVALPELAPLARLVRFASTAEEFQRQIEAELNRTGKRMERKRRAFARKNTWQERFQTLLPAVQGLRGPCRASPISTTRHSTKT